MDLKQFLPTAITILTVLIPAIWHMSAKFQKLQGTIDTYAARVDAIMNSLEKQLSEVQTHLNDIQNDNTELRERVASLESVVNISNFRAGTK